MSVKISVEILKKTPSDLVLKSDLRYFFLFILDRKETNSQH